MTTLPQPIDAAPVPPVEAPWRRALSDFCRSRLAVGGAVVLLAIVVVAIAAPLISPQTPYDLRQLDILDGGQPPGTMSGAGFVFWLGSDDQGRDMLSGIFYGLRISLLVGVLSTCVALLIGATLGLVAAYAGGRLESFIMRVADIQLSFPAILVALILLAVLGQGMFKIIIALVTVQWAYYARTVRSTALVERRKDYVLAARGLGLSHARIMFHHLLPNCLSPLIVVATVQVAHAITLEATLSFLGIGLPVTEPSLGLLIANGFEFLLSGEYWIALFPGLALVALIMSINIVGERLRRSFDAHRQ